MKRLYGHTPAADFGPKDLELVRQTMIDDLSRNTINGRVGRNRSKARQTGPATTTVAAEIVEATLAQLHAHVRAAVQVQELAGMRPQDVRNLRTRDLDRDGEVWVDTPWTHKTEHQGRVPRMAPRTARSGA